MNYEIDHQKLAEQILTIVRNVTVPAGLYIFLVFVVTFSCYFLGFLFLFGSVESILKLTDPQQIEVFIENNTTSILLLNTLVTTLMHFLLSGVYGIIKKSNFSQNIGVGDAFSLIFSKQGLKVLNVVILVQIASGLISYALNIAGFALVGFAIGVLIQFLTYFIIPAIYTDHSGIIKSLKQSVGIVNEKPGLMFAFVFMTYLLSLIGILFFGIGIIFTLPLNYIVSYSLYTHIAQQIKH
ncbi:MULTISPECIES: hypothetical protein [unclassified Flavobacterium]|uniref:hypothetical protein n=1 Tax=unclassified Flavobacterium TaxID=196869 RepID=UPI0013D25FF7|nr:MULTISPECIES: hypothetical protein [unclassified Flavobacterium]MBA5792404.1 hypothetical protein [Flavobacterium sp. xlx-221]